MTNYNLNVSQKQAIEYTDGPLLIIAGAGTGKTTVITQKIAYLIEQKFATPEQILALTFTDKAAGEMQGRVDEMMDIGYVDLQISTFHAFCQRLLEEYGLEIGLPNKFKLLTLTDAWLLMREHVYDFNLDYYRPLGNPNKHIHTLLDHFSKCKDELVSPKSYIEYAEGLAMDSDSAQILEKNKTVELAHAYHQYNQLLLDKESLDFGDIIFYCVKLLQERPNILKLLQERFKYILIDEFQDVNWAQYQLIRLLANKNSQLTVVGDDDQSIYAFRGSNVSIIMRFKEDYPDAKEIVLTENYRSKQEILDFAYASIQNNNPDRLEQKLGVNKKLLSGVQVEKIKSQKNVEHLHFQTLDDEVVGVIKKISEIKEQSRLVSWDDFAILVRANSHVEPFANALESHNIPYEYLASSGLYRQPIVLDAIGFLNSIEHIHDDRAIYRLLRMPFLQMKEDDLQKLTAMAKKKSIAYYEALKRSREFYLSMEGTNVCEKLISLFHEGMRHSRFEKPTSVLYQFLENSGYLSYLTHEEGRGNKEIIRQIHHLKQLFDLIRNYEEVMPGAHVAGFVEHYNYIIESGDGGKMYQPTDTPNSVNILTVHAAKGLEFKYVFVVNLVEERFPSRNRGGDIELPDELVKELSNGGHNFHYQEERRLFYVAITRAKGKLFLTSADDYGGSRKKKISRFLDEVGFETNKQRTTNNEQRSGLLNKKISYISALPAGRQYPISSKTRNQSNELPKIIQDTFSYSQINSYERCPYQYKLAHVLKIPMKGSASFSFGNTIHNTLQTFYERIQELNRAKQSSLFGLPVEAPRIKGDGIQVPTLEELLDDYEKAWIPDWYKSKQQRESYYQKGKEILKVFYASEQNSWSIPVSLEGWFKIKVGEYLVNGRIDRIDKQLDGSLEIIDYKTGSAKETLTSEDKQQLIIYQIAAQSLSEYNHIGPVGKLTFYYVNDNIKTSFLGENKDIEKLKGKLINVITQIQGGDFAATPGKHVCAYCDFKEICEFRQL